MSFRLVPKSVTLNDLEWRNGPYLVIVRYFTEFGCTVSGMHCVKVVDKATTMDNVRLPCVVVGLNACRGTARRPRYKFLADS